MNASNSSGAIFVWDPFASGMAVEVKIPKKRLPKKVFNPHGIDTIGNTLMVSNMLSGVNDYDQVEIFAITIEPASGLKLSHSESISSPLMTA